MKYAISLFAGCALVLAGPVAAQDLSWTGSSYYGGSTYDWSGFYAGINGGYGFGTLEQEPVGVGPDVEEDINGWALGGQVGYNVDFGGLVAGAEADLQWANIGNKEDLPGDVELESRIDSYGTIRARAGATFGPVMPFVTGGVAYGRGTVGTVDDNDVSTTQSKTHWGWTAGLGLEAAATENLTFKAEYQYVHLGAQTYDTLPTGSADVTHNFSVIRGGVNYKF
jgi:outer membrane immunogenic protein